MLLSDFSFQSSGTSYSMPSSVATPSGRGIDGPASMSGIIGFIDQIRKRKKKKKKVDKFGLHYYPNRNETNITYNKKQRGDGNPEWRRRYERYGLTQKSSDNRQKNGFDSYVGHYSIKR